MFSLRPLRLHKSVAESKANSRSLRKMITAVSLSMQLLGAQWCVLVGKSLVIFHVAERHSSVLFNASQYCCGETSR